MGRRVRQSRGCHRAAQADRAGYDRAHRAAAVPELRLAHRRAAVTLRDTDGDDRRRFRAAPDWHPFSIAFVSRLK